MTVSKYNGSDLFLSSVEAVKMSSDDNIYKGSGPQSHYCCILNRIADMSDSAEQEALLRFSKCFGIVTFFLLVQFLFELAKKKLAKSVNIEHELGHLTPSMSWFLKNRILIILPPETGSRRLQGQHRRDYP